MHVINRAVRWGCFVILDHPHNCTAWVDTMQIIGTVNCLSNLSKMMGSRAA